MAADYSDNLQPDPVTRVAVLAQASWSAFREHRIPATPRNYELFYTYYSGENLELTQRLSLLLQDGRELTPELADALYEECLAAEGSAQAISDGAEAIARAAQDLVDQVSGNQEALAGYGDVLAHWTGQLGSRTTVDDLFKAVAALTAETVRASERNRVLENELTASTTRIAKLKQDLTEVRQEATTDALTGIANRKAFDAGLRRALAQARSEPSSTFSLLMLDVDHFKRFNDTHGHRTGDHVLRLVARLLSDNVKGRDTAARYGGEEFAILLADADLAAGETVAKQICERLSGQRLVKRGTGEAVGQITLSIGVAQHRPGDSGTALVERADGALYEAKRTGRNRVCTAP